MKAVTYRRTLAVALGIAITVSLAACSDSSKPSESEAKQALQSYLGNCQYIDISKFRKVNGVPQQDGSYLIEVDFKATLNPPRKIIDFVASSHDPAVNADNPALDAATNALVRQQYAPMALSINISKIINTYRQDCPNMPRGFLEKIYDSNINVATRTLDDYAKSYSVEATQVRLPLIRTDNGWQLAQ